VSKVAVIFYPQKVDKSRLERAVDSALAKKQLPPATYYPTKAGSPGAQEAKDAIAAGAELIIVAGGDGTIRPVLQVLANHHLSSPKTASARPTPALGIIPVGTGNVLARNLGMPLGNLNRSAAIAVSGTIRSIDVGQVTMTFEGERAEETHVFGVMAGLGLDAKIFANTNSRLKRRIGWVAYIDGGLRSLPVTFERLSVSVNGQEPRTLKLHTLIVGNCGVLPGNINLMPEARIDDGLLDLAAVGPRRVWNWIDFWNRVTWVNWLVARVVAWRKIVSLTANVKTLENLRGANVSVKPERLVNIQLDGDPFGPVKQAEFEVLPLAVKVRV
jgi:diacylglycerol kinase family enzyme